MKLQFSQKYYTEIFKKTLLAIPIAVVFICIQRGDISLNSVLTGVTHGLIIGFAISCYLSFKKRYLNYRFRRAPFLLVMLFNSVNYLLIILFSRAISVMVTNEKTFQLYNFKDPNFVGAITFILVVVVLYNLLDQLSYLTGQKQLFNFAIGKYSHAQIESRMIMFLDMSDSTKITEQIGDAKYLSLLDDFFSLMTNSMLESKGEIYKYIGDEAIITWDKKQQNGLVPVEFFYSFKKMLKENEPYFLRKYGLCPKYRAGLHYGSLMIGELGSLKKEIALIGDSVNTTSRILDISKNQNEEITVSELIANQLVNDSKYQVVDIGEHLLKGKEEHMRLFSVKKKGGMSDMNDKVDQKDSDNELNVGQRQSTTDYSNQNQTKT